MTMRLACAALLSLGVVSAIEAEESPQQLVEIYEVEVRGRRRGDPWELVKFGTASGREVDEKRRTEAPPGWSWVTDWIADGSRGDTDGWEYSVNGKGDAWGEAAPERGRYRRRRWLRVMKRSAKSGKKAASDVVDKGGDRRKYSVSEARSVNDYHFTDAVVTAKGANPLAAACRAARSATRWCYNDFTFRGMGLGCTRAIDARSAGIVVQLPITPNFGFWERRSRYLPMATGVVVFYPPSAVATRASTRPVNPRAPELSDAMREAKRLWASNPEEYLVVACVLSVSYPVDILRRALMALCRPVLKPLTKAVAAARNATGGRAAGESRGAADGTGAPPLPRYRSVQRVGFSLSHAITIKDGGLRHLRCHVSPLRVAPWFMYAPGLAALWSLVEFAFDAVNSGATRTISRLKAAEHARLEAPENATNATALAEAPSSEEGSKAGKKKVKRLTPNATEAKAPALGLLRQIERSAAETCLSASTTLRNWCDSKTSLLGYSYIPYRTQLTEGDAEAAPQNMGFKWWRGSAIFMMRPFYPPKIIRRRP